MRHRLPLECVDGGIMKAHRIAVMPGDGIGKEVVPEGMRVLEAAARKHALGIEWREFGWNCDYYAKHGRMMPEDWFETLSPHDAIYYGAVGWPATVPDHVSLWGSLRAQHLTCGTESNGISITMPYWDERFREMAGRYPGIRADQFHIDILVAHFVARPERFDVVVGSNLFGDILSDLGPAVCGTIGIAPSANINPTREYPSLFEPVHGSAPDIAGKGIANPIGQIWCGAMMLEHLGHADAAGAVVGAIEGV